MRPVKAGAGQELDLPGVHTIAVVLDLVQPVVARRRFVRDTGELRLDPFQRAQTLSPRKLLQHMQLVARSLALL